MKKILLLLFILTSLFSNAQIVGGNATRIQGVYVPPPSGTNTVPTYNNGAIIWTPGGGGGGSGTVTSVGLSMPTSIFSTTGSPITTSGTFGVTLQNQTHNTILAGPLTGSGVPDFRNLVSNDIPLLNINTKIIADSNAIVNGVDTLANDIISYGIGNFYTGLNSVTFGLQNHTTNSLSTNIGIENINSGSEALSVGSNNLVSNTNGIAVGLFNRSTSNEGISIGIEDTVTGASSAAIGIGNKVTGTSSYAIGQELSVSGNFSYALGVSSDGIAAKISTAGTFGLFCSHYAPFLYVPFENYGVALHPFLTGSGTYTNPTAGLDLIGGAFSLPDSTVSPWDMFRIRPMPNPTISRPGGFNIYKTDKARLYFTDSTGSYKVAYFNSLYKNAVIDKSSNFTVTYANNGNTFNVTTSTSAITVTLDATTQLSTTGVPFRITIRKVDSGTGTITFSFSSHAPSVIPLIAQNGNEIEISYDANVPIYTVKTYAGGIDASSSLIYTTGNNGNISLNPGGTGVAQVNGSPIVTNSTGATKYFPLAGGAITGTAGLGYIEFPNQSSAPTTPASGNFREWSSSGNPSWLLSSGFSIIHAASLTASRTVTWKDVNYTNVAGSNFDNAFSNIQNFNSGLNSNTIGSTSPGTSITTTPAAITTGTNTQNSGLIFQTGLGTGGVLSTGLSSLFQIQTPDLQGTGSTAQTTYLPSFTFGSSTITTGSNRFYYQWFGQGSPSSTNYHIRLNDASTGSIILNNPSASGGVVLANAGTTMLTANSSGVTVASGFLFSCQSSSNFAGLLTANRITAISGAVGQVPITSQGFSGQTGNLQNWSNSTPTVLASVNSGGKFVFATPTTTLASVNYPAGTLPTSGQTLGDVANDGTNLNVYNSSFGGYNPIYSQFKGSATLSAGTVTVSNANIKSTSMVIPVPAGTGTTNVGSIEVSITAGTGFTMTSASTLDTRVVNYLIIF